MFDIHACRWMSVNQKNFMIDKAYHHTLWNKTSQMNACVNMYINNDSRWCLLEYVLNILPPFRPRDRRGRLWIKELSLFLKERWINMRMVSLYTICVTHSVLKFWGPIFVDCQFFEYLIWRYNFTDLLE